MAYASNPEKAPTEALAVKNSATRVRDSLGMYHLKMSRMAPGKKPALKDREQDKWNLKVEGQHTRKSPIELNKPPALQNFEQSRGKS